MLYQAQKSFEKQRCLYAITPLWTLAIVQTHLLSHNIQIIPTPPTIQIRTNPTPPCRRCRSPLAPSPKHRILNRSLIRRAANRAIIHVLSSAIHQVTIVATSALSQIITATCPSVPIVVEPEIDEGVAVVVRPFCDKVDVFAAEAVVDVGGAAIHFFDAVGGLVAAGVCVVDVEGLEPLFVAGDEGGCGCWDGGCGDCSA